MRTALLLVILSALVGCAPSGSGKLSEDEAKALKGGPMPAGTWEKIAASRDKYNREHGGGGASAATPTSAGN